MDIDLEVVTELFLEESAEGLAGMEEALLALESSPADDEAVGTLFRVSHTIKGNASSLGFTGVAEFTHVLEDVLDDLRRKRRAADGALVSALLEAVDALKVLIPAAAKGDHGLSGERRALLERLRSSQAPGDARPRDPGTGVKKEAARADRDRDRTLRVDIGKLDRMLTLSGELAIAHERLRQMLGPSAAADSDLVEAHAEAEQLGHELQELVMKARMVSLSPLFRQYGRTVRDVSTTQGKLARLVVEGEDVEVDTAVAEHIRDPITHMIRNAVDHGIEPPDVREKKGKDPCGLVSLRARRGTGGIVIEIADDGAGLDRDRITSQARARGLVADAGTPPQAELDRLVFEPGFSTADAVTELSGRGIGLDVVRRSIEALRGSVEIESQEDRGTTITLRFPLTLAHIRGLMVGVADETLIIPLDSVVECLELPPDRGAEAAGCGVVNVRGKALPFVRLRRLLGLGEDPTESELVAVVRTGQEEAGLAVDTVLGEGQVVIKPLGQLFRKLPGIAGSTILGNGRVALILDVPSLFQKVR
jgi:two-component system, chemotaxis family, sensor kinase CheA